MKLKRLPMGPVALAVVLTVSSIAVYKALTSESSFTARGSDIEKAKRIEPAPGGDFQSQLPKGDFIVGNGVVEPVERETRLAGPVGGVVTALRVKEGDVVQKSDVVVELQSELETAAVAVAEGELAGAQARYDLAQRISRRTKTLGNAATADELERTGKQVSIEGSAMQTAMARLSQAKTTLDRLKIRSPIAGEVLQIRVLPGEYYSPSTTEPLMVIGDMSVRRVRIDVDERDVGRVKAEAAAYIVADAYPDRRFPGRVVEIGRRMGRKNIRTDDPKERLDTKILEVLLQLEDGSDLVAGQRVVAYVEVAAPAKP